jgi:hypothetical protein
MRRKTVDEANYEVWKEEVKLVAGRRMEQKANILPSVYAVVWRQCTSEMWELLRSSSEFQAIDENTDVIALLKLIRVSTVVDQRSQHPTISVLQALNKFTSFRQMNLRNDVYLEGFRDRVNIYEEWMWFWMMPRFIYESFVEEQLLYPKPYMTEGIALLLTCRRLAVEFR